MSTVEVILISIGLAMDAFAVSVCKGLAMKKIDFKKMLIIGLYFGIFQGVMPVIGYLLGTNFESLVTKIDHWIAFILLGIIGGNMIKESCSKDGDHCSVADFSARTMFGLAVATSIDALAIGVSFAFLKVNIWEAVILIGITTALFSGAGIFIGNVFGSRFEQKAQIAGGCILILLGVKILLEHLGVIA